MGRSLVLFNPLANNKHGKEGAEELKTKTNDDLEFHSVLDIKDYREFFSSLMEDDKVILVGGDGTLNNFINRTIGCKLDNPIYLSASGSGNDFLRDIEGKPGELVQINQYLKDLPTVTVNNRKYRMINGIGYGIDGYCCEVADKIRATDSSKEINYTGIAIKGLLFHYKTTSAKITVDGKEFHFPRVWLAPTMHGRFYGGGMMPTPDQDRNTCGRTVSTMVMYGSGKLKTLMVFPKIFKGEHVKHTELCRILRGQKITVEFDRPVAAQVDGETILGVTSYTVEA
ncbi:MAG: hypothetical protein KBS81_06250 [Spirochaetales bacterium]|nr:hypothetical protein [Candidatus Physcosoma equi]